MTYKRVEGDSSPLPASDARKTTQLNVVHASRELQNASEQGHVVLVECSTYLRPPTIPYAVPCLGHARGGDNRTTHLGVSGATAEKIVF